MFDYPVFRKNVDYLDYTDDYLTRTGKSKRQFLDDLDDFEDPKKIFLDELDDTPASGTYANNPTGVWNENPFVRGNAIEDVANVPGTQTPPTFPKIDYYDAGSQTATSVKSTDLFAKSYQDITRLEDLWKSYVDDISGQIFPISQGNLTIGDLSNPVSNRVLHIVTPYDTPLPGQQSIITTIQNYANSKNVTVVFENIE